MFSEPALALFMPTQAQESPCNSTYHKQAALLWKIGIPVPLNSRTRFET